MSAQHTKNASQTLLTLFNHAISEHPDLAARFEEMAQIMQGKGFGAGSIEQEIEVVLSLLGKKPELAVDIGGNIGTYSAEIRRRNPNVEIHIFEPSKTNLQKLHNCFDKDCKIQILPYAVSNKVGSATLFANEEGSSLGSLTRRKLDHFGIDFNYTEQVNTIRFEDYWHNQLNERDIDIVKIDIEGHELSALLGFGGALKSTKVIQFEFGGANIDSRTYFHDFWYFFKENNFNLFRVTPYGSQIINAYREQDEFFSVTNYIAVNKKLI